MDEQNTPKIVGTAEGIKFENEKIIPRKKELENGGCITVNLESKNK